ncbi:MAG: sodium:proton antiporter [Lachnospiraceae bacterium]|nr:sodium:proton antiporter [Candidatus Equihabitans merdae]
MAFVQNFPFFSIILALFSGPLGSIFGGKNARRICYAVVAIIGILSAAIFGYTIATGQAYTYAMGHFTAPWGNEIRIGVLEAGMATFFCVIMLLSLIAGQAERERVLEGAKMNLYYIMTGLLLSSLLALIYTNDLFTAYVFVEINTISACGLIMIRQNGRTLAAGTRYMVMSLLGSGMFLLGICYLYDITGHLLMSNIRESVVELARTGQYNTSLIVAIGLMSVGLAVKCAQYPFHAWLPDAYGYSTLSSSCILSSLVSKGYIFILIKIFYRVLGLDQVIQSAVLNVLFALGIVGMIMGSISAIREKDVYRMVAYSSVAQIGYIFMGIGVGTVEALIAAIYHILFHAATKSLLFIATNGLCLASDRHREFKYLSGAGARNKLAGVAFIVGSLSMIGIPMFAGFTSKILFASVAMAEPDKMFWMLVALAISTILNTVYFFKTVLRIYTPKEGTRFKEDVGRVIKMGDQKAMSVAMIALCILNVALGLGARGIIDLIRMGLEMFG